jgi:cell division protein ZapA
MVMKNVVKVQLAGRSYNLTSTETADYTIRLSRELNKRLDMIMSASESLSSLDAALLCAMDCLDELTKANRNVENIRSQIKDYVDDAAQARLAAEESNKEVRILRAKVEELQTELKNRTTVIRYDNEKVENAKDMLSREISAAINSPLSRPTVQQINSDPNKK